MPTIKTIADVTRVHAAARPHQVAMVFKGRKTTYAELDLAASRVANALLDEGLAPQGRVAILDKNTDEFFEILYGAIKAGQVLVPVNWRLAPPEIAQIIDDAQAKILFVGPAYFDLIDKLRPALKTVAK
ncbi:MAG: AMP-binding protein, partial [Alphaproteobacteria bacterium]|nr:AMP-binding protein [Alphaproteobacteria bacterium]